MNFHVMTLFPEQVMSVMSESVIGRAVKGGIVNINAVNIRDFSTDKHRHVDDYPYGGGAGMVMQPGPIWDCYESVIRGLDHKPRVIYTTPQGKVFSQQMARELSQEKDIIFLCGHYEGVDERILEEIVTDNISIGDYVLTGGELPAMVMMDAIARLVPGVLSDGSAEDESFENGLLEYPQYTRPETFHGKDVPDVLLSGHHANIDLWRRRRSLERTFDRRPDMIKRMIEEKSLSEEDKAFLKQYKKEKHM